MGFEITAECPAGEKQRHGCRMAGRESGSQRQEQGREVRRCCMFFACSAFLCPSASRASSRQNRPRDCAQGPQARADSPIRRETSRALRAQVSPSLAESTASPIRETSFPDPSLEPRLRPTDQHAMPHPGHRVVLVPLALPPHSCQSAFSGRSWACPSSSTSRAEPSPSP